MAVKPKIFYGGFVVQPCETEDGWVTGGTIGQECPTPTVNTTSFVEGAASLNLGANLTASNPKYRYHFTGAQQMGSGGFRVSIYIGDVSQLRSTGNCLGVYCDTVTGQSIYKIYARSALTAGWNTLGDSYANLTKTANADRKNINYVWIDFITHAQAVPLGTLRMDAWTFLGDTAATASVIMASAVKDFQPGHKANGSMVESDSGKREHFYQNLDEYYAVQFNLMDVTEKDSYAAFSTGWAEKGLSFAYYPSQTSSDYLTLQLADPNREITYSKITGLDLWDWEDKYRYAR